MWQWWRSEEKEKKKKKGKQKWKKEKGKKKRRKKFWVSSLREQVLTESENKGSKEAQIPRTLTRRCRSFSLSQDVPVLASLPLAALLIVIHIYFVFLPDGKYLLFVATHSLPIEVVLYVDSSVSMMEINSAMIEHIATTCWLCQLVCNAILVIIMWNVYVDSKIK